MIKVDVDSEYIDRYIKTIKDEGYVAGFHGVRKESNPYPEGSANYVWWKEGWEAWWYDAMFGEDND